MEQFSDTRVQAGNAPNVITQMIASGYILWAAAYIVLMVTSVAAVTPATQALCFTPSVVTV